MDKFVKDIIKDIRVELLDEFDRNFQRKAFFDQPWPSNRMPNRKGSQMNRTGALRRGMRATIAGTNIVFTNSQPYAELQNSGGTITITPRMNKFFWAMYYKTSDGATKSKGKLQSALSEESLAWKRLALKKVGQTIKIDQRQFIGWHPQVKDHINRIVQHHLKDIEMYLKQKLRMR